VCLFESIAQNVFPLQDVLFDREKKLGAVSFKSLGFVIVIKETNTFMCYLIKLIILIYSTTLEFIVSSWLYLYISVQSSSVVWED